MRYIFNPIHFFALFLGVNTAAIWTADKFFQGDTLIEWVFFAIYSIIVIIAESYNRES